MQHNTPARTALFPAAPGEAGGWLAGRDNDTILRVNCGLSLVEVERTNRAAAASGRDSLVTYCAQQGVTKLADLPGWTGT